MILLDPAQAAGRLRRVAVLAGWLTVLAPVTSAAAAPSEYALEAALVSYSVLLTEWPRDTVPMPEPPLAVGILGHDRFGELLDNARVRQRVRRRAPVVRRGQRDAEARDPHVVFIAASENRRRAEVHRLLGGRPVLMVGHAAHAAARGCVVAFSRDTRVGFNVDTAAAAQARLTIRSRLVALAQTRTGRAAGIGS